MSELGKANYDGYRATSGGVSLVSGAPLPEYEEQLQEIRDAWDGGADVVAFRATEAVRAERDKAYRERARLVAFLAACYPSRIGDAPDAPGWAIVYVDAPTGQMSWHVAPDDQDLFDHAVADHRAEWDGHTTEEKYERLATLTKATASLRAVDDELERRGVHVTPGATADMPSANVEPKRYALVEQMGHRATVGSVRETTFAGKQMLELTDLKTGRDHLISPESLYEVTWLTEDEARARATPWTAASLPAGDDGDPWQGDDDDQAGEI